MSSTFHVKKRSVRRILPLGRHFFYFQGKTIPIIPFIVFMQTCIFLSGIENFNRKKETIDSKRGDLGLRHTYNLGRRDSGT